MPDPAIGAFVDRVVQLQQPHSDLLLDPPGHVDGAFPLSILCDDKGCRQQVAVDGK
jgi:hypothetical protein